MSCKMPTNVDDSDRSAQNQQPPRRTSSLNASQQHTAWLSRRHSMPAHGRNMNRLSRLPGFNMEHQPRKRSSPVIDDYYGNQRRKDSTDKDPHEFEDIPLEDMKAAVQRPEPEPVRRNLRTSLHRLSNRLSITPSDITYPAPLFTSKKVTDDPYKAEQILGLRPSHPPPVPPKPWKASQQELNSSGSLPSYNKPLPPRPLPPLNGRTAWLHALTAILVVGNCWGISNAFGLFQAYYTRYYLHGTPPSTVAWIGSTQLALVFGLGVPVGRLVDIGHFRLMFQGGTVLMLLGLFVSSVCNAFWSLWLTQGLLTGTGMGMVFCSGVLALMSWFDERKMGIAMGLGAAGSCVGGIVYVLLARHFLVAGGFATTMRILGGVAAASMIPPNLVFRMRDQRHLDRDHTHKKTTKLMWRSFTSPAYLFAAMGMFLTFLGVYFGFVYVVSFASEVMHLSDTSATNLLIFMLAANLPGRFIPALISDKCIGPLNTIIPAAILSSAVIWFWAASSAHINQASLTVMACVYGFVSAGVQVLYAPSVYTFCLEPASDSEDGEVAQLATDKMGIKAGGIFSCIGGACLVGTPIGGALISSRVDRGLDQPYLGAQIFAGTCLLAGGVFLLASRVFKVGWEPRRA